jgi:phenylacetate-coenzyme A ligase PaaK-like adenylate-forming protein
MASQLPDPLRSAIDQWTVGALATNILWTRFLGAGAVAAAQRQRFTELARHTRAHSPYYRNAWAHVPDASLRLADLPVVTKGGLMAAFDDWSTDRGVTLRDVERFTHSRAHIGELFRGRYIVWTSSGTTGKSGVYVQDAAALSAYDALVSVQLMGSVFAGCDWGAAAAQGGRAALVTADCDHFASIASWRRVAQGKPWLDMKSFAVTLPLREIVAGLNAFRPAFVASYPTVLALLADEQRAGRLHLRPVGMWSGGEVLSQAARVAIEETFACPLLNEYGASECLTIGYGCREGALHVNADWVILEPVDRDYRPTPPGELSHTVLLTNLANAVQPVIRYDLGDRVRARVERCPCGSPLPAIQVEGRCDDVVTFQAKDGSAVRLPQLALGTVVEVAARVYRFQIVQRGPDAMTLRLSVGDRARAGALALGALRQYLDRAGLAHIALSLDGQEPQPDARDGKLRQVIAWRGP